MNIRLIAACLLALAAPRAMGDPWIRTNFENAHVVIPAEATDELRDAAADFVRMWKISFDSEISFSSHNTGDIAIWLGKDVMPESLVKPDALEALGPGGFVISSYHPNRRDRQYHVGPHLVIAGNTDAATHDGVIEFFDRYLEFRWLAPGNLQRPMLTQIDMAQVHMRPPFRFREVGYHGMWQGEKGWEEWRRMCHLPGTFRPSHRRYAAEAVPESTQPNLASAETAMAVAEWIKANHDTPEGELPRGVRTAVWQADAGNTIAWTLNRVPLLDPALDAEDVDVALALNLAQGVLGAIRGGEEDSSVMVRLALPASCPMPPADAKVDAGVIVQLSDAACDFSQPLLNRHCEENIRLLDALKAWSATGATLFVSNHVSSLHNNLTPFANLDVLRDNLYAFTQYGVTGVYAESWDFPEVKNAENARLRAYVMARLLWNPDQVLEDLVAEFNLGYYGMAADQVTAFNKALAEARDRNDRPMTVAGPPEWLTVGAVEKAGESLAAALKLELTDRIRARVDELVPVLEYAQLVCPPEAAENAEGQPIWRRPKSRTLEEFIERVKRRGLGVADPRLDVVETIMQDTGGVTPPREEARTAGP